MGFLPQTPPAIAAPQPATDNALTSIVPNLYWSTSARGALLIVGAEKYKLVEAPKPMDFFGGGLGGMFGTMGDMAELMGQKKPELTPLGPTPRESWNPTEIASRFGAQIIRSGSVSSFAPLVLPDKSKSSNPFGDVDFAELAQQGMAMGMGGSRLLPLLASLSPSQLQQAASTAGLPLSSLDNQQRVLLQPLLRRTMPFRFAQKPNLPPAGPLDPAPLIPQSDQNQFRLRLTRALSLAPDMSDLPTAARQGMRMGMRISSDASKGGEVHNLALKSGKQLNPMAILTMLGAQSGKGIPARKKPSELNTDTGVFNAAVSLVGVTTVEELMGRVAQATKVALYADQRIGKLKVSARGTSARAGDVVQALCWAVGGAVRRISDERESVYLLTEQVVIREADNPLSSMMGSVSGMMQDQKSAERKAKDAKARLIRQKALNEVPRGEGASLSPRYWQLAEAKPSGDGNLIALSELTPELRKQMEEQHSAFAGAFATIPEGTPGFTKREPQPLTQVRCSQDLVAELVAPTLGATATLATMDAGEIHPELPTPTPPAPTKIPEAIKQRVLAVALPADEAGARRLVESATTRGLTELRVSVPVGGERALEQLGGLAKGKIALVAVIAPLEPLTAAAPRDRSWAGKSLSEWLVLPETQKLISSLPPQLAPAMTKILGSDYTTPEAADTTGLVVRLQKLLALPGVTGFALERLAAPGYREGNGAMADGAGLFWQAGANMGERVAFVKEQKSDAAELGSFSFADMLSVLSGGGPRKAWLKRTTVRNDAFIARLSAALAKASLTPASVLVAVEPARWEKWTGKFPTSAAPLSTTRPALVVLSYSRLLAQPALFGENSDFAGFDDAEQFTGVLGKQIEKLRDPDAELKWDGLVIDLADQSLETALALLERALQSR